MRDGAGQNREAAAVVVVMVGGWWRRRRRRKVVAKRRESTRLRARIPPSICQLSVHTLQLRDENFQGVLSCFVFGFFAPRNYTVFVLQMSRRSSRAIPLALGSHRDGWMDACCKESRHFLPESLRHQLYNSMFAYIQ